MLPASLCLAWRGRAEVKNGIVDDFGKFPHSNLMFGESGNSLQTVRKPSGGLCVIFYLKQPPRGWVYKDLALVKKSWCTTSSASQQHMLAHPRGHPQSTTVSSFLLSLRWSSVEHCQVYGCHLAFVAGVGEYLSWIFSELLRNIDAVFSLQVWRSF